MFKANFSERNKIWET